nr:FtsK/SpoIIIE family protein, putative EssC component of Type VII secretion system [Kibdelosporangium sp. MJ126-NF4]CTQ97645.1 FtsK/SpoIIIE family protein, putative EssC component of Type VII secretion system [Kibdelosporangium sp. MJ126-NF4]
MSARRIAFLVATSEHTDPSLRDLREPPGDGRRLRQLLLDPDVGGFDEVVLVANESKSGIERELERLLRECKPQDTVLIQLTGRAFLNAYSHLFFATVGTDVTLPYSTAVPSLVLWNLLFQCQAGVKVLLLDCSIDFPLNIDDYFGDTAYTFTATNQLTATLVRGLETGAADIDGDGQISVTDLSQYLGRELPGGWSARAGQFDVNVPIAKARPVVPPTDATEPSRIGKPDLVQLLGLSSVADFDPRLAWRRRTENDRFRVPIGVDENGQKVELDLKMIAKDGGMGPHGLVVGAPGSGKSELLRTIVLSLAATHPTDTVNFLLLDFSGGDTFRQLADLPQVSASLSHLGDDPRLLNRLMSALVGELSRRQDLLAAGSFTNFWEYEAARENGADLDPLPALVVVIDEFSALLEAKPGFRDTLLMLGRAGMAVGFKLLLAAEHPDEELLKEFRGRLTCRIGLRMETAEQSQDLLDIPDAAELPPDAGAAYLYTHNFKDNPPPRRFTVASASQPVADTPDTPSSVLDSLVARMIHQAPPAHEVWLPPLEIPSPLDTMMAALNPAPERGLTPINAEWVGGLQTPVGIVDNPYGQRRELLWADFSDTGGHGAVVGDPGSGKSMLLRTLVLSLAVTHTPLEAQVHCIDLGGGTLAALRELPHVGAVASASDKDLAQRIVNQLASLVADREQRFRDQAVDSMTVFRERKRDRRVADDPFGDVFLVVDGWKALGQRFPQLEAQVTDLVAKGLPYGVHVVVSAERWADIPPATKDLIGTRFELRLDEPAGSDVDARVAVGVPAGRPGQGLTKDKLHFLAGLPRIDGSTQVEDVDAGTRDAVDRIRQHWHGQVPPLVRPSLYVGVSRRFPIGVHSADKSPVLVDFDADPHLLVVGDSESGKSNVLRTLMRAVVQNSTEKEALFMVVDYRHAMLGYLDNQRLLSYAIAPGQVTEAVPNVVSSIRKRLPGADVTPEQRATRSWWSGPDLYLVVDDYDLVATSAGNPLQPLRDLVPHGKDIGLHLLVARRQVRGIRTPFDPILDTLKELGTPVVQMGQGEDETVLPPPHAVLADRSGRRAIELTLTDPTSAQR